LLIVVAVVGVLIAVAAPNLSSLYINNRLDTATNELMASINFARSEAIRRGVNVRVESAAGTGTRNWTTGLRVFVAGTGEVLRVGQPQVQPLTLFNVSSSSLAIEYLPSGSKSETVDGVFVLCYGGAIAGTNPTSRSRGIVVGRVGGVSLAPTDSAGRPLRPPLLPADPLAPLTSCSEFS